MRAPTVTPVTLLIVSALQRASPEVADTSHDRSQLGILVDGHRHHNSDDDVSRTMVLACSIACATSVVADWIEHSLGDLFARFGGLVGQRFKQEKPHPLCFCAVHA